ncbi:SDR family NAD(P)-dependent oxidoreductase [Candidatus Babeliales bacterium]|nr:SDR family NAD(P)-dependent oxidoreductase [Candidatus Babeliales bacterium]
METKNLKSYYQRRKILVTGGAGFIGSHLVKKLVKFGAHVTVLDNFSTGNVSNLQKIVHKVELIVGDIRSPEICQNATANKSIIFHLAAMVSVPKSTQCPEECFDINTVGTNIMLKATTKHKTNARVIFSSSAAVYGDQNAVCRESIKANPQSPYAVSKLEGEKLCQNYVQTSAGSAVALRYFNVFGPLNNDGVIAKFTAALKNREKITIFGDGLQRRDYVPVEKVVEANLTAGAANTSGFETFNIASGSSITLMQLLKKLEAETGCQTAGINFKPVQSGDLLHSAADCSKFEKLLKTLSK